MLEGGGLHFRRSYVSDLLDVLEREQGAGVHARLRARMPERLRDRLDPDKLRSNGHSDLMTLSDAEELLLAIDGALGDGSGRVLENAALDLFSRTLSRDAGVVMAGDLFGTVAMMRAPIEHPFVGASPMFDLKRTDTGLSLTVGIPGHPRSAKVLRGLVAGAIRAAARFCREAAASELKLYAEMLGDRASLVAHYHSPVVKEPAEAASTSQPPRRRSRSTTQPRLSLEVERILSRPPSSRAAEGSSDRPGPTSTRGWRNQSSVRPPAPAAEPGADAEPAEHNSKRSRR